MSEQGEKMKLEYLDNNCSYFLFIYLMFKSAIEAVLIHILSLQPVHLEINYLQMIFIFLSRVKMLMHYETKRNKIKIHIFRSNTFVF